MNHKLLMENWRKFLKEGISDVVYHYTSGMHTAAKILEENRFMASGGFTKDVESELGKGKLYFFSTSRTPINVVVGTHPQGAIFKLDGRALAQKYKGAPVDDWATEIHSSKRPAMLARYGKDAPSDSFESEDRILLDEPYIDDADTYIEEIHFAVPLYSKEKDYFSGEMKTKTSKEEPAV